MCWELVEVAVGNVNIKSQRSPGDPYLALPQLLKAYRLHLILCVSNTCRAVHCAFCEHAPQRLRVPI